MAKLTLGQKANRTLRLLIGLRNSRIAAALQAHGFTNDDLQEGWGLVRALGKSRLDAEPAQATDDVATLLALDEWENKWFPIAGATLRRHAPEVHSWFFKNLSQTEGPAVIVSVGTFVERWQKLEKGEAAGGPGAGGKAAKKKLVERGLSDSVIKEATTLIDKLGGISGPVPNLPDLEQEQAQLAQAETALWDWYLEWSQIARSAVKQRGLLRQLGFLQGGRGAVEEEEEGGETEVAAPEPVKVKQPA